MTYVEFFDKNVAENICTCLSHMPDRVVLIGDKYELLQKHANRYKEVFAARGYNVEYICRTVNKNNIQSIINALLEIVDSYEDCHFDVTGGDDLHLVAMGMVWQMRREKNIQIHRFNFKNNTVVDCDMDGQTVIKDMPYLSVAENIKVHGGDIIYDNVKAGATHVWELDEEFILDVDKIWEACRVNPARWNNYTNMLGVAEKYRENNGDELVTVSNVNKIAGAVSGDISFSAKCEFIKSLLSAGLIKQYKCSDGKIEVRYKNKKVKQCLTRAGLALEMKAYVLASTIKDDKGNKLYNDVMTGVCIDWDGNINSEGGYDTENEIDVVIMHGMIPVFVSCKNGQVDMDELYKLNTVASRFGGKYAKKVLIANSLNLKSEFARHLLQRANDMGIRIVSNMQQMSQSELNRVFKSLWCN